MKFKKIICLGLGLTLALSLAACGGSDGSKEAADAIRKEAAEDGVNIDDVIKQEQEEYEKQHEEYLQEAASYEEFLEQASPDAEAVLTAYNALKNAVGADAVKAAEEYNKLLVAYCEKWKDTDFKDSALGLLNNGMKTMYDDPRFTIPDTIINLMSTIYDNENYESYCFYLNKTDSSKIYVTMQNGDIYKNDFHVLKMDGSVCSPDFSKMEDLPDKYIGFKDNKLYVPYLGFGDYPFINWCFDLNGDGSGVGNSEEVIFEDMYEKGYGFDELNKAFIEVGNTYNSICGINIWE